MNDEMYAAEAERVFREVQRAVYAAAALVPPDDYAPFLAFAQKASLRRIEDTNEPIRDVEEYFKRLAGIYLWSVMQPGQVIH